MAMIFQPGRKGLLGLLAIVLAVVLAAGCNSGSGVTAAGENQRMALGEAEKLIFAADSVPGDLELAEITPEDVWAQCGCQLFKIVDGGSSWETFVVKEGKATLIGRGFGGFGVTSVVPYDVNRDGTTDLVYAFSFGSGLHRSVLGWLDMATRTEQPVEESPPSRGFRMDDLILRVEAGQVVVYTITDGENWHALRLYPTEEDIGEMKLVKSGVLVYQDEVLYNQAAVSN